MKGSGVSRSAVRSAALVAANMFGYSLGVPQASGRMGFSRNNSDINRAVKTGRTSGYQHKAYCVPWYIPSRQHPQMKGGASSSRKSCGRHRAKKAANKRGRR